MDKSDYNEALKAVKCPANFDVPEEEYKNLYPYTKDVAYFDGLRYRGKNYCVEKEGAILYHGVDSEMPIEGIDNARRTVERILINTVYTDGWIMKEQNTP